MTKKKKKMKKKPTSFTRPTMQNPLIGSDQLTDREVDAIKSELERSLASAFPPAISKKQVVEAIAEADPEFERLKDLRERRARMKSKRKEMRRAKPLNGNAVGRLRIGLRQCAKELNAGNNRVACLLLDSDLNLDCLKVIFDKGTFPIYAVPGLGRCVKKVAGFPATCLAFVAAVNVDEFPTVAEKVRRFQPVLPEVKGSTKASKRRRPKTAPKSDSPEKEEPSDGNANDFGSDFIKL